MGEGRAGGWSPGGGLLPLVSLLQLPGLCVCVCENACAYVRVCMCVCVCR